MRNRLLLIDDDQGFASPLRCFFEDNGLDVRHATSGEQGLLWYKEHKPDMIILDIILPDISEFNVIGSWTGRYHASDRY